MNPVLHHADTSLSIYLVSIALYKSLAFDRTKGTFTAPTVPDLVTAALFDLHSQRGNRHDRGALSSCDPIALIGLLFHPEVVSGHVIDDRSAMSTFPTPGVASIVIDSLEDHCITTVIAVHMNLLCDLLFLLKHLRIAV